MIEKVRIIFGAIMSSERDGSVGDRMKDCTKRDDSGCALNIQCREKYAHDCASLAERTVSAFERSCGAIVFKEMEGALYVLVIQHGAGHWSFPKGHMEAGESEHETAIREVAEETGIEIEITRLSGRIDILASPDQKAVTFLSGICLAVRFRLRKVKSMLFIG